MALISLPQNPESLIGNYVCGLTMKKLKAKYSFMDISAIGKEYFEDDLIHYNKEGHRVLAEKFYEFYHSPTSNFIPCARGSSEP